MGLVHKNTTTSLIFSLFSPFAYIPKYVGGHPISQNQILIIIGNSKDIPSCDTEVLISLVLQTELGVA